MFAYDTISRTPCYYKNRFAKYRDSHGRSRLVFKMIGALYLEGYQEDQRVQNIDPQRQKCQADVFTLFRCYSDGEIIAHSWY